MDILKLIALLAYGQWQRLQIWHGWNLIQNQQVILENCQRKFKPCAGKE